MSAFAPTDPEISARLAPLLSDVRWSLEHEMARLRPAPDLEDVVARAHALDAAVVPESAVRAAACPASVMSLEALRAEQELAPESRQLEAFLDHVRRHVELESTEVAARRVPRRRKASIAAAASVVAAIAVAAAAIIAVFPGGVELGRTLAKGDAGLELDAAHGVEPSHSVPLLPAPPRRAPDAGARGKGDDDDADDDDDDVILLELEPEEDRVAVARTAVDPAQRLDDRLARLDAEAQALWRVGDRHGAEQRLEQIARDGARSHRAELAFGDLFTLAHQLHGAKRMHELWRRYLRRFPRGHYADDASAGLCRAQADESALACWRRYLADWPGGAHRAEARVVLDSTASR